jgi:hypothetical protein
MASGIYSLTEGATEIGSPAELDRFLEEAESRAESPIAVSVAAHGYRADLLVGYPSSFIHLTPDDLDHPYYVTTGGPEEGGVDFRLQSAFDTWFPARYLIPKESAVAAFREFVQTGALSSAVQWEEYFA